MYTFFYLAGLHFASLLDQNISHTTGSVQVIWDQNPLIINILETNINIIRAIATAGTAMGVYTIWSDYLLYIQYMYVCNLLTRSSHMHIQYTQPFGQISPIIFMLLLLYIQFT